MRVLVKGLWLGMGGPGHGCILRNSYCSCALHWRQPREKLGNSQVCPQKLLDVLHAELGFGPRWDILRRMAWLPFAVSGLQIVSNRNKNTCTIDYISVYFSVRCHMKGVEAVVTSKKEKQWETSMWFQTKMFILDYDMQNEDLKLWCASYLPVAHHLLVEVCSITGIVKEVKLLRSNILCSSPYCTIWTVTVYILLLLCYYSIFLYK